MFHDWFTYFMWCFIVDGVYRIVAWVKIKRVSSSFRSYLDVRRLGLMGAGRFLLPYDKASCRHICFMLWSREREW